MKRSELLKAYKKNNWVSIKREFSGCYFVTVQDNVFRVETQENRMEEGSEWVITSVSGKAHNNSDDYVAHVESLQEAQLWLVNNYS